MNCQPICKDNITSDKNNFTIQIDLKRVPDNCHFLKKDKTVMCRGNRNR